MLSKPWLSLVQQQNGKGGVWLSIACESGHCDQSPPEVNCSGNENAKFCIRKGIFKKSATTAVNAVHCCNPSHFKKEALELAKTRKGQFKLSQL